MNITATTYTRTLQAFSKKKRCAIYTVATLVVLSACVTAPTPPETVSTSAMTLSVPTEPGAVTRPIELLDPSISKNPEEFALDLINLMGTSPGKCGAAAEKTPQVDWTCAEYTNGLVTFMTHWDRLITSAEVSLKHAYDPTSDWMYFAIDDEIDFYWKTYDLETTQVLVAYDPSEKGNELIIGLNPSIGSQIAAANGSHSFPSLSQWLPVKK